jgi:hypothetical protein
MVKQIRRRGSGAGAGAQMPHNAVREGAMLGLLAATAIWLWLAIVDAVVGQPFRTFTLLGNPVTFTIVHYALNVAYGIVLVAAIHGAAREPTLLIGVAFVSFIVEFGWVMIANLLSHVGLGQLAWPRILVGSVIGVVTTWLYLARRHPLRQELAAAEEAEEDE